LAAIGAAALLGLWGALDILTALKKNPQRDQYRIEEMSARYLPLAAALSNGVKVIGYLSDSPLDQPRGQVMFFSAQYALAPRLLSSKPDREWVLGNFAQQADWNAAGAAQGLVVERDLGNGLVLFRKAPRR
jgi:hypothetical protein